MLKSKFADLISKQRAEKKDESFKGTFLRVFGSPRQKIQRLLRLRIGGFTNVLTAGRYRSLRRNR